VKDIRISTRRLTLSYGKKIALNSVSIDITGNQITAIIGPSGCGKTTFLRTINRMNDLIPGFRIDGEVLVDNVNIYDNGIDVISLRKRIGMVFQKSNPFAKSIFENIAYGPRLNGISNRRILMEIVESALIQANMWEEVKDKLDFSALTLSGGQQQRLCIARTLAVNPEIILMDEPAGMLDPISMAKIEELLLQMKSSYTIVIVTHNLPQAARVSDQTAFFCDGELVEYGKTRKLFTLPENRKTEDYITGRFG
jgi:phosphate transport system ATP-binding protein